MRFLPPYSRAKKTCNTKCNMKIKICSYTNIYKQYIEGSSPSAPATFQKTLDFSRVFCYFHQPYTFFTRFHTGLAFECVVLRKGPPQGRPFLFSCQSCQQPSDKYFSARFSASDVIALSNPISANKRIAFRVQAGPVCNK